MRRSAVVMALAVGLGLPTPAPAVAQSIGLERVEELTRLGRTEEARAVLLEWWNGDREDASRRELQRGLWLRGRLTVDPVQSELDFQRLVVLYPRGPFTAQAILRLAQSAHAMGDGEGARRYVETLSRDYARAPETDEAEAWLAAAGPPPPPADQRAEPARDDPVPGTPPAATRTDPPPRTTVDEPEPAGTQGDYYVQLGAFAEEARAMALYEEVRASGVEVRVVRVEGSRFLHVRFGRFVERAEAADELERLTEAGISAALVRDERLEELVRGG